VSFHLKLLTYLLLTYLVTHSLNPWSRLVLEKLTGSQLGKKLPAFYGNRKFTAASIRARHLSFPEWIRATLSF